MIQNREVHKDCTPAIRLWALKFSMSFYNKFVFNYIDNKKWELKMGEQIAIDPNVLMNEKIAKETLSILLKTKKELDDFIENLEILSNQELVENIKESERAKERGETKVYSIEELKEELEITEEDLKEVEDVELE
jgi:hypothetical protein